MALELLGEAPTARTAHIPHQLQCDSSAKMCGQECQGCPASHVANSPGTTPLEFLGLRPRERLDTGGRHSSCDCKINQRPYTFVPDQHDILHTATSDFWWDGKGEHGWKGTGGRKHHTLMSLSMPPDMIWSLVSLKVTAKTWYVFWNVWTAAFFLISHS